jgi:hypothetical protein
MIFSYHHGTIGNKSLFFYGNPIGLHIKLEDARSFKCYSQKDKRLNPKMLGETYFRKGLTEEFFNYSPIKYLKGQGILFDEVNKFPVEWELNVLITGNTFLVLSSDSIIFGNPSGIHFKEWMLSGETDLGARIITTNVIIHGSTIGDKTNSIANTYYCDFNLMDINQKESPPIDAILGFIHNYNFSGRNFSCNIADHIYDFYQYNKNLELIDLYKKGMIDKSFLSAIRTSLHMGDNLEIIINTIDNIMYLISLFSINMSVVPIINLYNNGNIIGHKIRNLKLFPYTMSKAIIDNFYIKEGPKNALEQCYDGFCNLETSLHLKTFINGLIAMMVQPYIDLRFAILLLSYEFLLSNFLLYKGLIKEDIEKMNLQKKLYKINEYLKFIPSDLLKDDLREKIRNPLFHQGIISFMNSEDIYFYFKKYWELLIQIILKILSYAGKYLEPDSNNIKIVP